MKGGASAPKAPPPPGSAPAPMHQALQLYHDQLVPGFTYAMSITIINTCEHMWLYHIRTNFLGT